MAAAAKAENCVPSNVVTRIKELEGQLGEALFVREKGKLSPTPFGRIFHREATDLLQKANQLQCLSTNSQERGLLRVGALDVAMLEYLPLRIPSYLARHPGVELSLLRRPSFTLEHMLDAMEIDVAITDGPIQHPLLHSQPAYEEALYLATPASDDSANDALHDGHANVTAFLFNSDCFFRPHFETWLLKRGQSSTPIITIESYEVIAECVRAGLGISCFPESIATRYHGKDSGMRLTKLKDLVPSGVYFVWRRGAENGILNGFIQHMSETNTRSAVSAAQGKTLPGRG